MDTTAGTLVRLCLLVLRVWFRLKCALCVDQSAAAAAAAAAAGAGGAGGAEGGPQGRRAPGQGAGGQAGAGGICGGPYSAPRNR